MSRSFENPAVVKMLEDVIQDRAVEAKFLNQTNFYQSVSFVRSDSTRTTKRPSIPRNNFSSIYSAPPSTLHRTIIHRSIDRHPISHHRRNPSHLSFTPSLLKMVGPPPLSNPFQITLLASILSNFNLPSTALVLEQITSKIIIPPRRRSCSSRICTF